MHMELAIAVRHVLEQYNSVLGGVNDNRWRIEHSQVVSTEDLSLYESASIIPSVQPHMQLLICIGLVRD